MFAGTACEEMTMTGLQDFREPTILTMDFRRLLMSLAMNPPNRNWTSAFLASSGDKYLTEMMLYFVLICNCKSKEVNQTFGL